MLVPFRYLSATLQKILIANLAIFVAAHILPNMGVDIVGLFRYRADTVVPEVWRFVTYMFTHKDFFHILINMLMLWMFGAEVSRDLGDKEFSKLYFGSGIFGILVNYALFFVGFGEPFVIGASGALMGVMFAYCTLYPTRELYLFFVLRIQAKHLIYLMIGMNVLMYLSPNNISEITHLGGMLGAFLYFKFLYKPTSGYTSNYEWTLPPEKPSFFKGLKEKVNLKSKDVSEEETVVPSAFSERSEEKLDKILKKISETGINSLDEDEVAYLDKVSEKRRVQQGKK